jgi:hypothetical protein
MANTIIFKEQTVQIFSQFYDVNVEINAAEYDIVRSYFVGTTTNKTIAENFTVLLFKIAKSSGFNVLTLLDYIKQSPTKLDANETIIEYLNNFRSKNSLYGVSGIPTPIEATQRNILR